MRIIFNKILEDINSILTILKTHKKNIFLYVWVFTTFKFLFLLWKIYIFFIFVSYLQILLLLYNKKLVINVTNKFTTSLALFIVNTLKILTSNRTFNVYNVTYVIFLIIFRVLIGYPFKFIKISLLFFHTWTTSYIEDEIIKKKIFFKKYITLTQRSLEHVFLTEIVKNTSLEKKMEFFIFKRNIILLINIPSRENVEFKVYDYPYHSHLINNYKVENVNVTHTKNEITITSKAVDSYFAINIFIRKYEHLSYKELVKLELRTDDNSYNLLTNHKFYDYLEEDLHTLSDELFHLCDNSKSKWFEFKIISNTYNLLEENGIIVYYDSNYLYNNEILDKIIEQIK